MLFKISYLHLRGINLNLKIMDAIGGIVGLVIGIAIVVLIIWAIRELICWYWKINQLISLQKIIAETQLKIYEQNGRKVDWEKVKRTLYK